MSKAFLERRLEMTIQILWAQTRMMFSIDERQIINKMVAQAFEAGINTQKQVERTENVFTSSNPPGACL